MPFFFFFNLPLPFHLVLAMLAKRAPELQTVSKTLVFTYRKF